MKKLLITLGIISSISIGAYAQKKQTNKKVEKKQTSTPKLKVNVEQTTASGLKIKLLEAGTGEQAVAGSIVSVHYIGTLLDGKKFDSSRDRGQPLPFKLGTGQVIKGWDEGIAMLRVGDKAILTIPPSIGYGDRDMGTIPPNSTLVFEVELMNVSAPPKPFDVKGKDTLSVLSGLKYIVVEKGTDPRKAEKGKTVSVHYTGFLADGKIFDSSRERGTPFQFTLGIGQVIRGWDEGIALMNVGDKLRLIIPSDLAYGDNGAGGVIPPKATLFFDVELMDVK